MVHRDIKPGNIMLDEDGSVKIADFGIAKLTAPSNTTETRTVTGTPSYMSPEQVQGLAVDGRSDQFSLAVIAYEILTGERPFHGEHLSTIVYRIVAEEPTEPHRINLGADAADRCSSAACAGEKAGESLPQLCQLRWSTRNGVRRIPWLEADGGGNGARNTYCRERTRASPSAEPRSSRGPGAASGRAADYL